MSTPRGSEQRAGGLDLGFVAGEGWSEHAGLAEALRARGHRTHFVALDPSPGREPWSSRAERAGNFELRRVAGRGAPARSLSQLAREPRAEDALMAWVAETPCDVIHVLDGSAFGAGALRALSNMGRPTVVSLDDYALICPRRHLWRAAGDRCLQPLASTCGPCLARTWPELMPSNSGPQAGPDGGTAASDEQAAALCNRYSVAALQQAERLIVPSRAALEPFVRVGLLEGLLCVVEPGLDCARIAAEVAAERARAQRDTTLRVGMFGPFTPPSGAVLLVEAFRDARPAGLALELHGELEPYHGDDRYARGLRELVGATPGVSLHPEPVREQRTRVLASLDGVAAPSLWSEPSALAVREARAAGLPVLVSDLGALPELAQRGRAGVVVPAGDRAAWSSALARFASDSASRARWSAEPHELRSLEAHAAELEQLYLDALRSAAERLPPAPARMSLWKRWFGR